jgi:hypothetical protein
MKLQTNPQLKNYLWEHCGADLLSKFPPEIRQKYPFIFETGDTKTLLALENEAVQEHIRLFHICLIEGMCKMALEEILFPLTIVSRVPDLSKIEIDSIFQIGSIHLIEERTTQTGFILSRFKQQEPQKISERKICADIDEVINTIAGFENNTRINRDQQMPTSPE